MTIQPYVYILASRRNGTLYTGVTANLTARVQQHKAGTYSSFTKKYGVTMLMWCQQHETMEEAITHEKRIKRWRRKWKLELIEAESLEWRDLFEDINA